MRKSKIDLVRGWLEKARRDLKVAQRELNSTEPFTDIICFHAQQAAEKCLKAYLVWNEIEFPKTHALEQLILLAAQKDPEFLALKDEVVLLTPMPWKPGTQNSKNPHWKMRGRRFGSLRGYGIPC